MRDDPDFEPQGAWRRYGGAAAVAMVFLAGAYGIYSMVNGSDGPKKRVPEIIALKIVPPPPPPPPKEEPPPPPPKMVEQKIEPPEPTPDNQPKQDAPPPDAPLALDATGAGAGDAFGLGAKPGGTPLTLGGGGGGGGGAAVNYGRYASLMQDQIGRRLRSDDKLNIAKFRATIRVWLTAVGKVDRVQVLRTTGDTQLDAQIEQVIGSMPGMPEAPPKEMPQPIVVRIGALPGVG